MKIISIYKPEGTATFEVGAKLVRDGDVTELMVISISYSYWFGKVTIKLSDGSQIVYRGFPVNYST